MKPQILILVKKLTSGGAEKQSVLLAKALSDSYTVHYVILNASYQEPKYMALLSASPLINVVAFEGVLPVRLMKLSGYVKKNRITHVFSYLTAANFYAALVCKFQNVKAFYPGIRNAYLPPLKLKLDRFVCNHMATTAVLNCYSGETYFQAQGFKKNKMLVIPNCFEGSSDAVRVEQALAPYVTIISVGRFVAQKDYHTALQAMACLKTAGIQFKYQIIGYGELEGEIRQAVNDLQLNDFVDIYINPDNIGAYLAAADVYLSTSLFEGTSNAIMEAMHAGLPVIATAVGDNRYLIEDKTSGYIVAVKNVEQIVEGLQQLIEQKELRESFGRNSKKNLLDNYSVSQFRKKYENLIENRK